MDALRGMALVLVVFDHAIRFTEIYAGGVPEPAGFFSQMLNPLRMPAMVFLSGMLLHASLAKGPAVYVGGKVRNVLYPYLLWSVVYVTLFLLASPVTGGEHRLRDYLQILYLPPAHLWFLHNLFLFYLLMLVLRPVPRLVLAAGGFAAALAVPEPMEVSRFCFLFAFFALGDAAGRRAGTWERIKAAPPAVGAGLLLASGLAWAAWAGLELRYQVAGVPFVLGGLLALVLLAEGVCRTAASTVLRHIGRNSLTLYVLHWLAIAAAAVPLGRVLPPGSEGVMLALTFAAGLLGSLALAWAARRIGPTWLFALPRVPKRRLAHAD
ncbi:acyltransferase [Arenibaculum sp.]|uniref:acyltransferase n=1 Tax=Arenibaculum sp. TaxID=2865862 RepID=UPI002E13F8F3|nr:acyltransferase [Arenibaculum sp.]